MKLVFKLLLKLFLGAAALAILAAGWVLLNHFPKANLPVTTIGTVLAAIFAALAAWSAKDAKVSAQEIERTLDLAERLDAQINLDALEVYKNALLQKAEDTSASDHADYETQGRLGRVDILAEELRHILNRSRALARNQRGKAKPVVNANSSNRLRH